MLNVDNSLTLPRFVSSGLGQSCVSCRCCSSRTVPQGRLQSSSSWSTSAFSVQIWRCFPATILSVFFGESWCFLWSHSNQRPRHHWPHWRGGSSTQPCPERVNVSGSDLLSQCYSPLLVRPLCLGFSVLPIVLRSDSLDFLLLLYRRAGGPKSAPLYCFYFSPPTLPCCEPAGNVGPWLGWCWISDLSWQVVPGDAEQCLRICFIILSCQSNRVLHTHLSSNRFLSSWFDWITESLSNLYKWIDSVSLVFNWLIRRNGSSWKHELSYCK